MAGSLLDFGDIAQRAQQQVRDAIGMQNMQLHQQQLGLQERQTAVNEKQLEINQQSEQNSRLNSIRQIWQDPRVQHDPELSDQLFGAIAPMVGIPTDGLQDRLTQSHKDRHELMTATLGNDPQKAQAAVIKLMSGMEPDKAATFLKNIESVPALHARAQLAKQTMEINEAKFGELRQNQAIVNEGRGPLTALSSILRDQTQVFNSPEYKKAQSIYKTVGKASILDPTDKTLSEKEKGPLKNLMMGNADRLAENLEPEIMRWQHQMDTANRALIDMDHGITQPGQMKEQLTARISTAGPILGALRDMQAAYRDPLNSEKAELAKHAYKTIEARRVELEAMDKKLDAQRMGLVNLANEKFDYKQSQDSGLAEAQRRFLALPEKQRNGAAAGKISKAIQEEMGIEVLPSKIYEDPNRPASQVTVNNAGESEYVKGFAKKQVDRDDSLRSVAEKGQELIDRASRVRELLNSDEIITGAGADFRLAFAKGLKALNWTTTDSPENTEQLAAEISQNTLDHIKASGLGTGNGFTEKDLAFLQNATGGRINLERGTLLRLSSIQENVARAAINKWNARLKTIPKAALDGLGLDRTPMPLPPSKAQPPSSAPSGKAQPQSGAVLKALPQGSKQIGTSGGKPVYQDASGKKWIGE